MTETTGGAGGTGLPGAHGEVRKWTEIDRLERLGVVRLLQQEFDSRWRELNKQGQEDLSILRQELLQEQQEFDSRWRELNKQEQEDLSILRQELLQEQQEQEELSSSQQLLELDRKLLELDGKLQDVLRRLRRQQGEFVVRVSEHNSEPLNQTKNSLWIANNLLYKTALEDWDRKDKLLTERVDRMEKRSGDLKNEIYQLVGFFTVLQGVVLTAVTQMTQSTPQATCQKVWSPVLLTGLAWIVTSIGVGLKLKPIVEIDKRRKGEDSDRKEAVHRAQMLRTMGPKFTFGTIVEKNTVTVPDPFWMYFFMIVLALSVFTGVFIASYFLILCNRGLAPIAYSN